MIELEVISDREVDLSVQSEKAIELDTDEVVVQSTDDYEKLRNKPKLNGIVIQGNIEETDPTVPNWAKAENKPVYTAEELKAVSEDNAISIEEIDLIMKGL